MEDYPSNNADENKEFQTPNQEEDIMSRFSDNSKILVIKLGKLGEKCKSISEKLASKGTDNLKHKVKYRQPLGLLTNKDHNIKNEKNQGSQVELIFGKLNERNTILKDELEKKIPSIPKGDINDCIRYFKSIENNPGSEKVEKRKRKYQRASVAKRKAFEFGSSRVDRKPSLKSRAATPSKLNVESSFEEKDKRRFRHLSHLLGDDFYTPKMSSRNLPLNAYDTSGLLELKSWNINGLDDIPDQTKVYHPLFTNNSNHSNSNLAMSSTYIKPKGKVVINGHGGNNFNSKRRSYNTSPFSASLGTSSWNSSCPTIFPLGEENLQKDVFIFGRDRSSFNSQINPYPLECNAVELRQNNFRDEFQDLSKGLGCCTCESFETNIGYYCHIGLHYSE